jgi:putative DNA primase/helicase
MIFDEFLSRAQPAGLRRSGEGYLARCPAHDDHSPSLSISEGDDGRILLHCWAGCETHEVVAALGLRWCDLFPEPLRKRRR